MSPFRRATRQALTIARRDFIATVFTPTFLIFLFAPLLMIGFGAIGGIGAAKVAGGDADKAQLVAVVPAGKTAATMAQVDTSLRTVFRRDEAPPPLLVATPDGPAAAQTRSLFDRTKVDTSAVLTGPLERPTIVFGPAGQRTASYLAELAEQTLRAERAGGTAKLSTATTQPFKRVRTTTGGRNQAAFFSVLGIFFLTILLAGQAVGTMAEERSNKVVEVLAAAVPLESVFVIFPGS